MEEAVVKFLAGLHIHVKLNWLKAVILFAKLHGVGDEEVTLCNAVVEQLLHSDLSDSYEPLTKVPVVAVKAVIVKQMIFQVVSVVNIARSCYDQYRECINNEDDLSWFYGDEDENGPEQQSPDTKQLESPGRRRMLKIRLFDGQNTVHAIEYGGKLALDENTLPGTKILLTARVLLRKGILLLNSSNCQVLNGDIDGKPIDLKSLFAERLGIKQDVKGQRSSTISPFLVRIPRIPNQGIHNRETTTQDTNDVKKEVYDSERTAVVPPLQNNLAPAAVVPPLHNNFVQKSTFVPSRIQKKLLLPFDESSSGSNAASAAIEDLPIPLSNSQIIPHVLEKHEAKICRPSLSSKENSQANRSIMEYFPVSRNKREVAETSMSSSHPIHPVTAVPFSEQLVVAVNKKDKVVETELRERDEVKDEDILLLHNMATPPNTRKNIPPALNSSPATSNATVKAEDPIGTEIFAGMEETVMMTTQELINSSSPEISSLQNDSDLISFIANSLSKEVNVQEYRSSPRTHWTKNPPSSAVVPYKRGRMDDRAQQIQSSLMLFPETRLRPTHISIMDRFNGLNVIYLNDAFSQRKFWMLPKVVRIMGICHIKGELVAKHGLWLLDVCITDESVAYQKCTVDSQLLEGLLGFSVKHCEKLCSEKNMHELSRCKRRALEVMKSLERLDLVFSLEVYPEKFKLPLLVNVCCLAEALNVI